MNYPRMMICPEVPSEIRTTVAEVYYLARKYKQTPEGPLAEKHYLDLFPSDYPTAEMAITQIEKETEMENYYGA